MSYIQAPAMFTALVEPVRHGLHDPDAYVRKTAAMCVAKMFVYDRRLVDKNALVQELYVMLHDTNSSVVSDAVVALLEISEQDPGMRLTITEDTAFRLLRMLDRCTEWGQTYILEVLMFYVPDTTDAAEHLAEDVAVSLQHTNSAVVLACVKVIMYLMNYIASAEFKAMLCYKLSPPLVTLLASPPEVQYVALRNILLIIQRRPLVLQHDIKMFFCRYNDPIYIKTTKLEIIYRLVSRENAMVVLPELQEYASEVDVEFARRAVRIIGRVALRLEPVADRCVAALVELIHTRVNYVVQEAVIVMKDILRQYPNRYESVIALLCEHLDTLDEPQAKVAIIWIIGQYADRIENSEELLDDFLYTFREEPVAIQLALLTATAKLFLKRPSAGSELVPKVLNWATEHTVDPDCRDRGFMYWRLLSSSPEDARRVILAPHPRIRSKLDRMDRQLLDQLLLHASTLAAVFHRQPQTFIRSAKARYMPDSPVLDVGARRHASSHIHEAPSLRAPLAYARRPAEERERVADADPDETGVTLAGPLAGTQPAYPAEVDTSIFDEDTVSTFESNELHDVPP